MQHILDYFTKMCYTNPLLLLLLLDKQFSSVQFVTLLKQNVLGG